MGIDTLSFYSDRLENERGQNLSREEMQKMKLYVEAYLHRIIRAYYFWNKRADEWNNANQGRRQLEIIDGPPSWPPGSSEDEPPSPDPRKSFELSANDKRYLKSINISPDDTDQNSA